MESCIICENHEPKVSIIIPTYGRAATLSRALQSVLRQSYKNLEIIIVDDNNPCTPERYETEKVVSQFLSDKRIVYLQHEKNKNGAAARNTGIRASSGKYIMFLDDDDEFLNEKIKKQVECLEKLDFTWGACYTKFVKKRDGVIVEYGKENREGNLLVEQLKRNLFIQAGSNLMLRKEVVDEIGGFDESFNRNQDLEFMVRVLQKYKIAYVDELGLAVNLHSGKKNNKKSYNPIDVTNQFVERFRPIISKLSVREQNEIMDMINLQIFRYRLFYYKKPLSTLFMIFKGELKLSKTLRYMVYLLKRKLTKACYPFME